MINVPKTLEEAQEYRYTKWALSDGTYKEGNCAYAINDGRQCSRKGEYGPATLYCKQHSKMIK